jgi:TPR repeat protein
LRTAILIAAEEFPQENGLPPLSCPGRDVDELKRVLESEKHWPYRCVTLKNAEHTEVLTAIYEELQDKNNELVLIYYSGHGKLDRTGRLHLCSANTRLKLLPVTSVPADSIRQYVDESAIGQTILILDCCFSGAIDGAFRKKGVAEDEALSAFSASFEGRGIYLITSSTRSQTSREKEGDLNSVFTTYLIEAIESTKNDLGYLSMDDAYAYIYSRMRYNPEQIPTRSDFGGLGQTYLAKTEKSAPIDPHHLAKKHLLRLYASDDLPFSIAMEAAELSTRAPEFLDERDRELIRMLSQLISGTMPPATFAELWLKGSPEQTAKAVKPSEQVELHFSTSQEMSAEDLCHEGDKYYSDQAGVNSYSNARACYERAAALGSAHGMYHLGLIYENGQGVQQDYLRARQYFEGAAAWNSNFAMRRLGALYRLGNGVERDHTKALMWYERAAKLGNTEAMRMLGQIYTGGDGVAPDYSRARSYYEEAARLGNIGAFGSIAAHYENGLGVNRDLMKAQEYYEKGMRAGDNESMHRLGHCFWDRDKEKRDPGNALKFFEMAANAGNIESYSDMARVYADGDHPNVEKALEWCNRGIEAGSSKAMLIMGIFFHEGKVVPRDDRKWLEWTTRAADLGLPGAMNVLGSCYKNGYVEPKDLSKAREWYEKSAKAGDTGGMRQTATLLLESSNQLTRKMAITWLEMAVARGDADSMYILAKQVSSDRPRSLALIRQAAEAGSAKALVELRRNPPTLFGRLKSVLK